MEVFDDYDTLVIWLKNVKYAYGDTGQVTYKGRVFSFTTEKELITLGHWACDGLVIDVATDVWAKGRHYYTVQLAIEHGVKDLIRKLKVEHNIDLY